MRPYEIILHHSHQLWSLDDLAWAAGVHPQVLSNFIEYGLIEPVQRIGTIPYFEPETLARINTIQRLRSEVGVNIPGIAIILDLTEKIRQLQQEVEWLRVKSGI